MNSTGSELVALQRTLYGSRNPTRRWLHCTRRDWIVSAIRSATPCGREAALEVGPGCGVYLPELAQRFERVLAIDIEPAYLDAVASLRARHSNIQVVEDDITASAQPAAGFDLILCTEVIEHIPDSHSALREMFRLLRPGGVLLLSTPQRYSLLEMSCRIAFLPGVIDVVRLIYGEAVLPTGHVNLLTERSVREQLVTAGFQTTGHHKSGVYVPLLAEFGGMTGLRIARSLERLLLDSALNWVLWTQYFIARKPAG